MAVHMRNGIQYGGIPNGTVKGVNPSTVPTTVKQLNQIGTVGNIAPVTIPSAVKFSNGDTLETAIGSVATIETSPAVAAHDAGEYIFYNGQMYKVIAAIAVGETLTVDTNIEATSVGAELTALNNGLTALEGIGDYSTTEKEIGKWIDGRTVYRRVVELDSDVSVSPSSWISINALPLSTYKHILNIRGYTSSLNNMWNLMTATDSGSYVRLLVARDGQSVNVRYLLVEYLKD